MPHPLLHSRIHVWTVLKVVTVIKDSFQHAKECWALQPWLHLWLWCSGMDPQTCTHADYVYIQLSRKQTNRKTTAYTASLGLFRPFSLLIWLQLHTEWAPPSRLSVNSLQKNRLPWPPQYWWKSDEVCVRLRPTDSTFTVPAQWSNTSLVSHSPVQG